MKWLQKKLLASVKNTFPSGSCVIPVGSCSSQEWGDMFRSVSTSSPVLTSNTLIFPVIRHNLVTVISRQIIKFFINYQKNKVLGVFISK